jgi:hypothetical protein
MRYACLPLKFERDLVECHRSLAGITPQPQLLGLSSPYYAITLTYLLLGALLDLANHRYPIVHHHITSPFLVRQYLGNNAISCRSLPWNVGMRG